MNCPSITSQYCAKIFFKNLISLRLFVKFTINRSLVYTFPLAIRLSQQRMPYYAVHTGIVPGIYSTWEECEKQVLGFPSPIFKKFATFNQAQQFVQTGLKNNKYPKNSAESIRKGSDKKLFDKKLEPKSFKVAMDDKTSLGHEMHNLKFIQDKINIPGTLIIYTDGACSSNGRRGALAGYGVHFPTLPDLDTFGALIKAGPQTNQRAELMAIQKAIEIAGPMDVPLEIRTDSMYSIDCLTKWCHAWRKANWPSEKKNLEFIREIIRLANGRKEPVYFVF